MAARKKKRAAKKKRRATARSSKRVAKRRGKRAARKKASKSPVGWMVQFRNRLQAERAKQSGYDSWSHLREVYRVEQHALDHAARIRESESGMQAQVVPVFEARSA